jgi:hypothetical protein
MPRWINLRKENRILTRGGSDTVAQGHWIVYRQFRIGQFSEHWDEIRKEAIGGPKFLYDDMLIRAISRPKGSISKGVIGMNPVIDQIGEDNPNAHIYGLEHCKELKRIPMIGDNIFEIMEHGSIKKPKPPVHALYLHLVIAITPEYGDNGRAEMYYLHTIKQTGVE